MHSVTLVMLAIMSALLMATHSSAQYGGGYYEYPGQQYFFRSSAPASYYPQYPSYAEEEIESRNAGPIAPAIRADARLFWTTLTLTTTSTTTYNLPIINGTFAD